jgi:hypothetical protein
MKICKKCYFTQVPTIGIRTLVMISTVFAKPRCPKDLDWLKGLCGDGALAHEHNGKIYLTELSTGKTEIIGKGAQPEFSPDTSKLAWLHGYEAKGCMRKGDRIIYTIAIFIGLSLSDSMITHNWSRSCNSTVAKNSTCHSSTM